MTALSTSEPASTMTFANATPASALHPHPAVHQQPTHPTTAAEKTRATATTTAKALAATEIPTIAAATASKSSHEPTKTNHAPTEAQKLLENPHPHPEPKTKSAPKKKRAKSWSVKYALQLVLEAGAATRTADVNRRLVEAIVSVLALLEGLIATGLPDEIAAVVRRESIDMFREEVLLVALRVETVAVTETDIARSGGSRIAMCQGARGSEVAAGGGKGIETAMVRDERRSLGCCDCACLPVC